MNKTPHPVDVRVGHNLRQLRLARSLTQEKLAERTGITFQQIQKYEKGTNRISASRLLEFAEIMKVDIKRFYDGIDTPVECGAVLSRENQRLLAAFERIKDPKQRGTVIKTVEMIAA
ncbi:helix-turn-helix domain-containing protein [Hoeflea poritis]|uniref:Helix-turn-helix transcriptional regulator n=1 Tax=Hoeflea poritis TaxID=2993659 RepID=A0ABT4VMN0_9HYPH|nr:helix-turn-helix transcriptional regulator [Hoeflea poritis]MDA4845920.1 helix-turn-helix transcriptional regulator [Hoeflea poritis]